MKNKIKLFDKLVFLEMINQLKITGIIASAIYLVIGIISSLGMWVNIIGEGNDFKEEFPSEVYYILIGLIFIFIPIMVKVVFSYQNRRNASDLYHALPVKRETMYFSSLVAVLAWSVAIMVIAVILPWLTSAILPHYTVDYLGMIQVLGNIFVMAILMIGGFALGINLTGNHFTNIAVSLMILFVPRVIIFAIFGMTEGFMPFLTMNSGTSLVNSSYNLLIGWAISAFGYEPGQLHYMASFGYTLVLGLGYIALGALAYKHRRSEMAAQASAFKLVQPITRMIPAYLFGLIGVYFFLYLVFSKKWDEYGYDVEMMFYWGMFSMFILSILSYVIYELITTRRWRKVAQSFKQLPIVGGVTILSALVIWLGVTVSMNKEVEADKMKYIEVAGIEIYNWYDDKREVRLEDEELFQIIEDTYREQLEDYKSSGYYWGENEIVVGINQGGVTFYRRVFLSDADMQYVKYLYMHAINADKAKFELPKYDKMYTSVYVEGMYYLPYNEKDLYDILKEDLKDKPYLEIVDVEDVDVLCTVEIESYKNDYFSAVIPISVNTPKTYDYLIGMLEDADNGMIKSAINAIERFVYTNETFEDTITISSFISIDGDEVVLPGNDEYYTRIKGSQFEKFIELLNRVQNEEGDTLVYIEGWLCWYEDRECYDYRELDFTIGKRVPKELADELYELLGK